MDQRHCSSLKIAEQAMAELLRIWSILSGDVYGPRNIGHCVSGTRESNPLRLLISHRPADSVSADLVLGTNSPPRITDPWRMPMRTSKFSSSIPHAPGSIESGVAATLVTACGETNRPTYRSEQTRFRHPRRGRPAKGRPAKMRFYLPNKG